MAFRVEGPVLVRPGEVGTVGPAPTVLPGRRCQDAIDAVVTAANRTMVLVSGGSRASDDAMIEKAAESMSAGATGLIFGRNVWQRDHDQSLRFIDRLREILAKYPTP